ncbi:MAG: putative DNA-binding domain-containing protein [Xanthobacteraceae bacterium]
MQRLADRQREFAAALLDPALAAPPGLLGPDREPSPRRFAVYRNNVVAGLTKALAAAYPAVCRIVGEEFFRAMARVYVRFEPPASPVLLNYGAGFATFIAHFEPAGSLPYLPDVARIERGWTEAYHAPEAAALAPQAFAAVPNDRAAEIRLDLHPSLRVVRSAFPALTIWRMNVGDSVPGPVDLESGGEDVLVVRPAADVEVRSVPHGGAEFIASLANGQSLTEATMSAISADQSFDLSASLATLIGAGVFVGYSLVAAARRPEAEGHRP